MALIAGAILVARPSAEVSEPERPAGTQTASQNGNTGAGATDGSDASSPARTGDRGTASTQGAVQGGFLLAEEMSGREAIEALGDDIGVVADRAGKSVEEIRALLLRSPSAHVTPQGDIVYRDGFGRD